MFIKAMRLSDEMHYINAIYSKNSVFSLGKLASHHLRNLTSDAPPADGVHRALP